MDRGLGIEWSGWSFCCDQYIHEVIIKKPNIEVNLIRNHAKVRRGAIQVRSRYECDQR